MGKVLGEGRPPAKLMMPGFSVTFRISRITDGFIFSARCAWVHFISLISSFSQSDWRFNRHFLTCEHGRNHRQRKA